MEGTIYIPLEDFWEFVEKYAPPHGGDERVYGVPRVVDDDIRINFAASTISSPNDWSEKPACVLEWKELK